MNSLPLRGCRSTRTAQYISGRSLDINFFTQFLPDVCFMIFNIIQLTDPLRSFLIGTLFLVANIAPRSTARRPLVASDRSLVAMPFAPSCFLPKSQSLLGPWLAKIDHTDPPRLHLGAPTEPSTQTNVPVPCFSPSFDA